MGLSSTAEVCPSPPDFSACAAAQAWDAAVDAARLRIASDPALGRAPLVGAALLD